MRNIWQRIRLHHQRSREQRYWERSFTHYHSPDEINDLQALLNRSEGDTSSLQRLLNAARR